MRWTSMSPAPPRDYRYRDIPVLGLGRGSTSAERNEFALIKRASDESRNPLTPRALSRGLLKSKISRDISGAKKAGKVVVGGGNTTPRAIPTFLNHNVPRANERASECRGPRDRSDRGASGSEVILCHGNVRRGIRTYVPALNSQRRARVHARETSYDIV